MGEKEQGLATAREPHTGRASGRMSAEAEHDPGGGGIAIGEEGVQVSEPGQGGAPSALATNLNSSKSNVYRSESPIPGKPTKDQRVKAGLETAGGALASGAARTSDEGDSGDSARISTNVTIEEPKQKHFGE